ncbi:hypothetical protein J2Z60_001340 [Lactobacillus colini]|uniref:Phage protein n=1 Tax=Lactobacillus colini TaxID=1819254 RepID=A0ABS4MEQ0_9LACO|nr:hypothetical protein [Lactobacillus colini]MBP2058163.1 hypothetical protein [Lactobacillus colini]
MAINHENKRIGINLNYDDGSLNLDFSDNLTDEKEQGYILSAAFFSFAASQGITKEQMLEMVDEEYGKFSGDN